MILYLLQHRETVLEPLSLAISSILQTVKNCQYCGNFDMQDPCSICNDQTRDTKTICIVETISDLWALERSQLFRGRYHILGGVLSALNGIAPEDLRLNNLEKVIKDNNVQEVIIATGATVDGQTTAHYIAERLKKHSITLSALAHGMPIGGELDELDDGTINAAFKARKTL
jgi:recombination protein RecR